MLATVAVSAALALSPLEPQESASAMPSTTQSLLLPDGRTLSWLEVGAADGQPVLFFHGGADSRLEALLVADAAERAGVRLIAADRPGFGLSSPAPGRSFRDGAVDVVALADHLGLETFDVMGHSGGGPPALVTAASLPERVSRVAVVAGAAPRDAGARGMVVPFRIGRWLTIHVPTLHRKMLEGHLASLDDPARFLEQYGRLAKGDGALFAAHPEVGKLLVADMKEGYRQGVGAAWSEAQRYYGDWGVDLAAVRQPVCLFYGDTDANAAPSWGRYLEAALPNAHLTTLKGEGHISALVNHADGIFASLLDVAASTLG